ncbi:hypothetical protein D3C86_2049770 [compost metagenome]
MIVAGLFVVGQQKMPLIFRYFNDIFFEIGKHRVVKKHELRQYRLAGTGGFGRFIEQNMVVDDNADVSCENKVGQRRKEHSFIGTIP